MTTRIVNIKHNQYDHYIGRAGNGEDGAFGNPIRRGQCIRCRRNHAEGRDTLPCFTGYFYDRLHTDADFKAAVLALKDKTLGCFCKPMACHGDVIAAYLDGPLRRDFYRASGDVLCAICYFPFYDHPTANEPEYRSGIDGRPFLHRICNGDLVKL